MTTKPILVDLSKSDSHPTLTWTIKDSAGVVVPLNDSGRTVELYYFEKRATPGDAALWKVTLTKSGTPGDGKVTFTPDVSHPYYPQSLIDDGGGLRTLVGWLRYHDTAASPVVDKWIKNALRVSADVPPSEPV